LCGSFEECTHDTNDDADPNPQMTLESASGKPITKYMSRPNAQLADEGTYEIVSNAPILPYSEVFNTYGEGLTNAQLLVRYGFALDENENDCITWDWGDLRTFAAAALVVPYNGDDPRGTSESSDSRSTGADDVMRLYGEAISLWPSASLGWTETGFVCNPETNTAPTSVTTCRCSKVYPERAPYCAVLCLNGDGKISHHLWLYCALVGYQSVVHATNSGVEEIVMELQEVASLLTQLATDASLEDSSDDNIDCDGGQQRWRQPFYSPRTPIAEVVAGTIHTIMCLCRSRSTRIGKDLLTAVEVGEELDRIPPRMSRTRKAMVEVLSEKSLLESVQSAWSGIGKRLEDGLRTHP